jgi:hypothetical protein
MSVPPASSTRDLPKRLSAFAHAHRFDLTLSCVAIAVVLPTFWYRYGLDQSLYQYIGAGWMHGHLPYLRAFDVKPPGIYFVYGVSGLLFRDAEAGIRIAEAACIVATGWASAGVVPREARQDGVAGIACLLSAAWNALLFGFWDTGQVELWEGCCLVFAFVALARARPSRRAVFMAGVWLAVAFLFKITAALAAVPLLVMVVTTGWKEPVSARVRSAGMFAAGALVPIAAVVLYFVARRGGAALLEWLLYLPHYARAPLDVEWVRKTGPEMLLVRCGTWFGLLSVPIAAGIRADRARTEGGLKVARDASYLLLAGAASIVLQRRYFSYHPVVLGPLLVLAATPGLSFWIGRDRGLVGIGACAVVAGTFFSGPTWTGNDFMTYRSYVLDAWIPYMRGKRPRESFLRSFGGPFQYTYVANEAVAALIESRHPTPRDRLHVRGYDTTLYTLTGLRSPSRFFMEAPLGGYFSSFNPSWVDEHERVLHGASAPRFFVTQTNAEDDIQALLREGYGLIGSRDRYLALERGVPSERLGSKEASELIAGHRLSGVLVGVVPFELTFTDDGQFSGSVQGSPADGTWRATSGGEICATLGSKQGCAGLFASTAFVLAFDRDWKELARIDLPKAGF